MPPSAIDEMRTALAVHHTATSEGRWDGPDNESRLKSDADQAYYRQAYAWQDPDGDPETKAAFRFIHHEVGADGAVGAANTRACSTGIAVLNGARGGTKIPAEDRQGVYDHLAAHLKDADKEVPDLAARSWDLGPEKRSFPLREMRVSEEGRIVGYAAVFDTYAESPWGFREIIRPGAFAKSIADGEDVRCLWNHDSNFVLGRTKNGTLALREDPHGLWIDCRPPDTSFARDFVENIRRGDVDQMSFAFDPVNDNWGHTDGKFTRELLEVKLGDVSPVTYPFYPTTQVTVRAALQRVGIDEKRLLQAMERRSPEDRAVLLAACEALRTIADGINRPAGESAGSGGPGQEPHLALRRNRQRLAELQTRGWRLET